MAPAEPRCQPARVRALQAIPAIAAGHPHHRGCQAVQALNRRSDADGAADFSEPAPAWRLTAGTCRSLGRQSGGHKKTSRRSAERFLEARLERFELPTL